MTANDRKTLLLIIAFSLIIHVPIFLWSISIDTCVQMAMTDSVLKGGGYTVEGNVSEHFSPLLPTLYLPFAAALGPGPDAVHVLELVILPLLIYAAYVVGSLYSREAGLTAAFFTAIDPVIYGSMAYGLSEGLVTVFLLGSFYYIIRGTKNSYYLMGSAVFSVLLYLTKASTGYLILAAICVGFVWRLYYDRLRVFRDRGYILAAAVFLFLFGLWSVRNYIVLGTPWISRFTTNIVSAFISEPLWVILAAYLRYLAFFGMYLGIMMAIPILALWRSRPLKSIGRIIVSEQKYSAIGVFIIGIWLMSAFFAAAIATEVPTSANLPHIRYVAVVNPLIYVVLGLTIAHRNGAIKEGTVPRYRKAYGGKITARWDNHLPSLAKMGGMWYKAAFTLILIPMLWASVSFYPMLSEYKGLYDAIKEDSEGVVWSDEPELLRYNLNHPDMEVRHLHRAEDITANMTLALTSSFLDDVKHNSPNVYSNLSIGKRYAYFYVVHS